MVVATGPEACDTSMAWGENEKYDAFVQIL